MKQSIAYKHPFTHVIRQIDKTKGWVSQLETINVFYVTKIFENKFNSPNLTKMSLCHVVVAGEIRSSFIWLQNRPWTCSTHYDQRQK